MKLQIVLNDAKFLKTYKVIRDIIISSKFLQDHEISKAESLALKITNELWEFEVDS